MQVIGEIIVAAAEITICVEISTGWATTTLSEYVGDDAVAPTLVVIELASWFDLDYVVEEVSVLD